jgi:hypothetical protein
MLHLALTAIHSGKSEVRLLLAKRKKKYIHLLPRNFPDILDTRESSGKGVKTSGPRRDPIPNEGSHDPSLRERKVVEGKSGDGLYLLITNFPIDDYLWQQALRSFSWQNAKTVVPS